MSLSGAGEFALGLAVFDVAPHRHPVADVVREQRQPVPVAALVEQLGLAIEEFLDLPRQQQAVDTILATGHLALHRHPVSLLIDFGLDELRQISQ